MSMGIPAETIESPTASRREPRMDIIDCDVHPLVAGGVGTLRRYVTDGWRKRWDYRGPALVPMSRYSHPAAVGNAIRVDATTPAGEPGGTDREYMRTDWLDRFNIRHAILLPLEAALANACPFAAEATVLASAFNRYFAEEWLAEDDRFRLAMVVAPQDPLAAARQIRDFADAPGIVAVWIPLLNILLGNVHYRPILEAAHDVGLPIVVHPVASAANFQGLEAFAGGVPSHYAERHVAHMQIGLSNLSSLIFEGTFERFRELRVVFVEYGWSWLPSLLWRMDSAWRAMRADVPWLRRLPSEYVYEHVRFTTQPIDEPASPAQLEQVIEMMRGEQLLLFSSDYPHWDNDNPDRSFPAMSTSFKQRVFSANALETFGERLVG